MITVLLYIFAYFFVGWIAALCDTKRAITHNTTYVGERGVVGYDYRGDPEFGIVDEIQISRSGIKEELSCTMIFWPILTPFRILSRHVDKTLDKIDPKVAKRKQQELEAKEKEAEDLRKELDAALDREIANSKKELMR